MNERERGVLSSLAETMIPAEGALPSGRQAGVGEAGLDRVLDALPELAPPLTAVLGRLDGTEAFDTLDPEAQQVLGIVVAGAYLTEPAVVARLGYRGRAATPVRDDIDDEVVELLEELLGRVSA